MLLRLYWEFFKIGLFSVGGGLATVPFLTSLGQKTGWFTAMDVANMLAVSESTPGPIGVNMATYVGFTQAGIPGGIIATLGLATPSLIVILLIARALQAFRSSPYVEGAFYALRPASSGLISAAGWSVIVMALANTALYGQTGNIIDLIRWKCVLLFCVLIVATNFVKPLKKLHPAAFLGFAALCGIIFRLGGV